MNCAKCGLFIDPYDVTVYDHITGQEYHVDCSPVKHVGLDFDPEFFKAFKLKTKL